MLRRWLFDRGDNLAGGIYGTILVTSIVAATDFDENIWRSLALVLVTTVVFWLAHVYAHALAASLDVRERISLAGAVGLLGTMTAYRLAVAYGVAALVWWGFVFARKERLSTHATVAVVLVNASFGLFIVAMKELVGH